MLELTGTKIKKLRQTYNLTRQQIADFLEITEAEERLGEQDIKSFSIYHFSKLATLFLCKISDFEPQAEEIKIDKTLQRMFIEFSTDLEPIYAWNKLEMKFREIDETLSKQ